ncbi:hypothetical protein AAIG33_20590 [Phytobacter ursingii]|uniref:hypothetical protein n=1 Tax=Phytobacter ursingii TaxID=1972431 RepID=UPI0031B7B2CA
MTQLPSKVRLAQIASFSKSMALPPSHDEIEALACFALAALEQEPVGTLFVKKTTYSDREIGNHFAFMHADCAMKMSAGQYPLYTHPAPAHAVPVAYRWNYGGSTNWRLTEKTPDPGDNDKCPRVIQALAVIPDCIVSNNAPVPAVPDIDTWRSAFEYSERQRDEGFNLHKFGTGYADDATQKRWESWLSSRAAMLNGGKS